jgi:hypothetical protein
MRLRYSGVVLGLLLACSVAGAWAPPSPAPAENAPARRLLYIGLALYSEAWSENDVVELADELSDVTGYRLVPMIASNVAAKRRIYPIADGAAITSLVRQAAEQAGADDLVFINISTRRPKVLAGKIGSAQSRGLSNTPVRAAAGRPTIIFFLLFRLLIDDLRAPGRIIITAARADAFVRLRGNNSHTLFGRAELAPSRKTRLHQVFAAILADVARMEHESHGRRPSRRCQWAWYDRPIRCSF